MATRTSILVGYDDAREPRDAREVRVEGWGEPKAGDANTSGTFLSSRSELRPGPYEEVAAPTTIRSAWLPRKKTGALQSMTLGLVMAAAIWVGLALLAAALMWPMTLAAHLGLLFLGSYVTGIGAVYMVTSGSHAE